MRFKFVPFSKEYILFFLVIILFVLRLAFYSSNILRIVLSFLFVWIAGVYLQQVRGIKKIAIWSVSIAVGGLILVVVGSLGYGYTLLFKLFYGFVFIILTIPVFIMLVGYYRKTGEYVFLYFLFSGLLWLWAGAVEMFSVFSPVILRGTLFLFSILLLGGFFYLVLGIGYPSGIGIQSYFFSLGKERKKSNTIYSKLIQTENTLLLQDRLVTIGIVSAGFVHEFKNVLSLIRGLVERGIESSSGDEKDKIFDMILQHITSGLSVSGELLEKLALQGREEPTLIDLRNDLKFLYRMVRVTYRLEGVNFIVDIEPGVKILVRRGEIEQILLNIIRNSVAVLHAVEIKDKWIKLSARNEKGSVTIEIEDNAGGLDDEVIVSLFEPRYKKVDDSGLGLFFTRELVEKNGGNIEYIKTDEGSIFRITFLAASPSESFEK